MNSIKNYIKSSMIALSGMLPVAGCVMAGLGAASCTEPESNLVEFVENNKLNSPNDTLFSLMGIIGQMQTVADRTVLLGEVRGDLCKMTEAASLDLKNLANFESLGNNPYNRISDYYAVIQNCNYFLENADTVLTKRGVKVFEKEYAVVKTYRAWTYLQLAMNYGKVPFVTKALLTEKDADVDKYPKYDIKQIADYFISDLAPYVDTEYPSYGSMNGMNSKYFYIPVRVLLGDLCLWAGRYDEAAKYYHDYLTKTGDTHPITVTQKVYWENDKFESIIDAYSSMFMYASSSNLITAIPMETREDYGLMSDLENVFCSTTLNNYYYQATFSEAYSKLSRNQRYVLVQYDPISLLPDTISPVDLGILHNDRRADGDLRLFGLFRFSTLSSNSSNTSSDYQICYKQYMSDVAIYRLTDVYLRYAEALNRAGYSNSAFAILKYGLYKDNIEKYIPEYERKAAGNLISFSEYVFTRENTVGIHSRGCGSTEADVQYAIPELPTLADSITYVEDMICDEMALELSFQGTRYYDLMRISMHRNDATYLAGKVANRSGYLNSDLYTKLTDQKNWYLPIK